MATISDLESLAWRPPAPVPASGLEVGLRIFLQRAPDLLLTLPRDCYTRDVVAVPIGRRPVVIVNDPALIRRLFIDDREHYPKSDLMVAGLRPLLGDGVLISSGAAWEHDRRMLAPAFEQMRLAKLFPMMQSAVQDFVQRLGAAPESTVFDLEAELSRVTADIMFRAIFSAPIGAADAADVFASFSRFQRSLPQFDMRVVLSSNPDAPTQPPAALQEEAAKIRAMLAARLDARIAENATGRRYDDLAQAVIDARDEQGQGFSREQVIDQFAVFFLAGHETTASALAWTFYLLSQQPEWLARVTGEIEAALGDAAFDFDDGKRLPLLRNVFREALRLYPPVAFLTRRAMRDDRFGKLRVRAGSFIVVSPWLVHRHQMNWHLPDRFDPSRFERATPGERAGAYMPFGLGPRVCTGATIAQLEAALILCEVLRRHRVDVLEPEQVFPNSRVTIRPAGRLLCRLSPRIRAT